MDYLAITKDELDYRKKMRAAQEGADRRKLIKLRAEVERLRKELAKAGDHSLVIAEGGTSNVDRCHRVINKLHAEVERLRAENEKLRDAADRDMHFQRWFDMVFSPDIDKNMRITYLNMLKVASIQES